MASEKNRNQRQNGPLFRMHHGGLIQVGVDALPSILLTERRCAQHDVARQSESVLFTWHCMRDFNGSMAVCPLALHNERTSNDSNQQLAEYQDNRCHLMEKSKEHEKIIGEHIPLVKRSKDL